MPFLAIVHLAERRCAQCDALLAMPGARSFLVDANGLPVSFNVDDPPAEMTVEIRCPNDHVTALLVPNEVAAEETLTIPERAPIAVDATLRSGTTESGATLTKL